MIKRFLKKIDDINQVLDFQNVIKEGFFINFIISQRGAIGKTFGAKEFALDEFIKYGKKTVWVVNTGEQIKKEKTRFLKNNKQVFPDKWDDVEMEGDNVFYKGKEFIRLIALSGAEKEKGARDNQISYIIYDEFNVCLQMINTKQYDLLDNLFNTFSNVMEQKTTLKCFIFGNNKTVAVPIFNTLKIKTLIPELQQKITDDGLKLFQVYHPTVNVKVANKRYKNNPIYRLGMITGNAYHSFLNENLYDIDFAVVGEITDENLIENKWKFITTIVVEKNYFELWKRNRIFYFQGLETKKMKYGRYESQIICGRKQDLEPLYFYNSDLKNILIEKFKNEEVGFDSIITKTLISKII